MLDNNEAKQQIIDVLHRLNSSKSILFDTIYAILKLARTEPNEERKKQIRELMHCIENAFSYLDESELKLSELIEDEDSDDF